MVEVPSQWTAKGFEAKLLQFDRGKISCSGLSRLGFGSLDLLWLGSRGCLSWLRPKLNEVRGHNIGISWATAGRLQVTK